MPHIKNALIRYRIIDKCLRNKYKPFPTKKDLREACEENLFGSIDGEHICDSTIEKDMFAMKMEHDAPIKYSKREKGYYYENPDFTINEIPLTGDDIEAIAFAAKTLSQFRNVKMFAQFGSAIDKIVDSVSVSSDEEAQQYIQFETVSSVGGSEFLSPLLEAIKRSVLVKFDYEKFSGGDLESRNVIPLLLKQYRNRWYLISFDISKKAYRTFGFDRMEELEVTNEVVSKPVDFDPDNYFKHAVGITGGNKEPFNLIIQVDNVAARYLDSLPIHSSQKVIEMGEDYFKFSLLVTESEELKRELLSFAGSLKIIEPAFLKKELEDRAKRFIR